MAVESHVRSVHNTLGAGVEDVMTLTQQWDEVEILNHHATGKIWVTGDNTAISAIDTNGTDVVPPNSALRIRCNPTAARTNIIRLFSDVAAPYSIIGK